MTYQAFVTDDSNQPLAPAAPANYEVIFRIYDSATGDTVIWSEKQTVSIFQGNFSVLLGNGQVVGAEPRPEDLGAIFTAKERYMGITVGENAEFSPRQRILPNAYAYRAKVAESVGGVISLDGTSTSLSGALNVSGAGNIDGNLDVDGHTWLDGFSSTENSDLMGNLRVGMWADQSRTDSPGATGYDVTFYSQVGDARMRWDQSERQLRLDGGSRLYVHGSSWFDGNALFKGHVDIRNNFYHGVDGAGHGYKIFSNTEGAFLNWNPHIPELQLMGATKMYINNFLSVNGDTQLDGFRSDGDGVIYGTLSLSNTADFNGNLDVDGYTNLDGLTCDGPLTLTGSTTMADGHPIASHGWVISTLQQVIIDALSDKKLKKNIQNIESGSLNKLLKLRSVTFEYNKDEKHSSHQNLLLPSGTQTGFIAQEVEEIFPDWVADYPSLSAGGDGSKEDPYKYIPARGFKAVTVEAIRELRAEKDAQIDALKQANSALETRLARLEALLGNQGSGLKPVSGSTKESR